MAQTILLAFLVLSSSRVSVDAQALPQLSERQTKTLIKRIKQKSARFHLSLTKELERPPLVASSVATEFTQYLEDLTLLIDQIGNLRLARNDVSEVLRTASAIERLILCTDLPPQVVNDWASFHAELALIARITGVKWSEAVFTNELIAQLENDATRFADNLRVELLPNSSTKEAETLIQDLCQPVRMIDGDFVTSNRTQYQVAAWNRRVDSLRLYLRGCSLSMQLQMEWRRLSAQVEELVRLGDLDVSVSKPLVAELFTKSR